MSEMKHTPGPWMPVQLATNIVQIQPESEPVDGMVICTVESHWDVMPAGRVKDVKLIAAAPELLEACKEALPIFEGSLFEGSQLNECIHNLLIVKEKLQAAIAKATNTEEN